MQALGVAQRADRNVDAGALGREGGQVGRHHHGGDVLGLHRGAAGIDAKALEHGLQALLRERRVLEAVARAVEADHQAVADQHVVADALDLDQVLDAAEGENGCRRGRQRGAEEEAENSYIECAAHEAVLPSCSRSFLRRSCRDAGRKNTEISASCLRGGLPSLAARQNLPLFSTVCARRDAGGCVSISRRGASGNIIGTRRHQGKAPRVKRAAGTPGSPTMGGRTTRHGLAGCVFLFSPRRSWNRRMSVPSSTPRPRPAVLCILDGWGWRPETVDNAIAAARTPNYTRMLADSPHALLATSGRAVGLPTGQMGNSEVGHMNIGAGRVVAQDLPRIDLAIEDGSLASRPALLDLIAKTRAANGAVHVMGLLSPGGVHSHQDHIAALVKALAAAGLPVFVHAFLDGRDVPPRSALGFLETFEASIVGLAGVRLATVSGRYYAMDRDKRWDRVRKAYAALVDADAHSVGTAREAIAESYAQDVGDEFVLPCVVGDYAGMSDGDALLFANFRADRAREISLALLDRGFAGFERGRVVRFSAAAGMTEYSDELNTMMTALFPAENVTGTLGELIAARGLKQLRIAETEKYAMSPSS